jgi:LysR family glycine cleavage system transcriptional activator
MRENWRLWMMAAGVEGVDPERGPGFNLSVLVVDAALLGQGVALARSALVDHHLRAGRLVRPFDIKLPANFAYYVVYPPAYRDLPKLRAFVDWMMDEAAHEESDADVIAAGAAAATN